MTKYKGLWCRKFPSESHQVHQINTGGKLYTNYTGESNLNRQTRPVSVTTVNGNSETSNTQSDSELLHQKKQVDFERKKYQSREVRDTTSIMDLSTNLEQSHVKQRIARFYQQAAESGANVSPDRQEQRDDEQDEHHQHHHQQQQQQVDGADSRLHLNQASSESYRPATSTIINGTSNTHSTMASGSSSGISRYATVLTSTSRMNCGDSTFTGWSNHTEDGKNHLSTSSSPLSLTSSSSSSSSSGVSSTRVGGNNTSPHEIISRTIVTPGNNGGANGGGCQGHLHHPTITSLQCTNSLSSPPPPAESPILSGASSSASNSSISSPYSHRQMDIEGNVSGGGYTSRIISSQSHGKKRKRRPQPIPDNCKDDAYWERRKRNNESAKRSRELRRRKEQQTTMRVIYLEQDNLKLKTEVDMLRTEVEKLQEMLFARNGNSFH